MILLGIDSATEYCSVALWQHGQILRRGALAGRQTGDLLRRWVGELLAEAGLAAQAVDALTCGIGPGGFAGMRVGVGFCQGLALALDRPVVPLDTFELLSQQAEAGVALVALDARMGEVYFQALALEEAGTPGQPATPRALAPAQVAAAASLTAVVLPADQATSGLGLGSGSGSGAGSVLAIGSGWRVAEAELRSALGCHIDQLRPDALPHIADGLALAAVRYPQQACSAAELRPLYLRDRVALTTAEREAARAASAN